MNKAIKWQIPFASLSGTLYRIDIYADGYSGDPIQLTAGESPFVTEEDSSEDFFAPIRTKTGSIQVCTRKPDGTMLTIDEILPANNIDHPVRLINLSNSNAIEWQGFLSCEAYSQNYTAIPENLTLSVISVLEAMDSVEIDKVNINGIMRGNVLLYYMIDKINTECGLSVISNVAYSRAAWRILQKYFDTSNLFYTGEYINESSYTYMVIGISCKKFFTNMCKFMGWIARENASTLYFQRVGEEVGMFTQSLSSLKMDSFSHPLSRTSLNTVVIDMIQSIWMGTDHKKNIIQGAKSTGVVAKIEKYEFDLSLPKMPETNLTHNYASYDNDRLIIDSYSSNNINFDNRLDFYYEKVNRDLDTTTKTIEGTVDDAYNGCVIKQDHNLYFGYPVRVSYNDQNYETRFRYTRYIGAFFTRLSYNNGKYEDGLYIAATNKADTDNTGVIFRISSKIKKTLYRGILKLKASAIVFNWWNRYSEYRDKLELIIKIGDSYFDGVNWSSSETYCEIQFIDGTAEYSMLVPDMLYGEVSISIRGCIRGGKLNSPEYYYNYDLFLKELSVTFEPYESHSLSSRDNNEYLRLLETYFRDEINIDLDIASWFNNIPSPSVVIENPESSQPDNRYMEKMLYNISASSTEARRPEVDLLNRLAAYYGAARQRLELEVAHPTAAPLPLLKLNGINDGKVYLPLSESRDWQTGVCKLTCFETPT